MSARRRPRRARTESSVAIVVSALLLSAILLVLASTAWQEWRRQQREAAAWRRVGHCSAVGESDTVTCTGVRLVTITLPSSFAACDHSPCSVKVNAEAEPAFTAALAEVDRRALGPAVTVFQTVNRRRCRDARTGSYLAGCISKHSYGIAVDFRSADDNRHWARVADHDPRVLEVVDVFRRHGFRWGATFRTNPDPQHLEWIPR